MATGTHKIPQNVTQYQGRIVGKFTAKQFIFLAIGGMAAFLVFNIPMPDPVKIGIIAVIIIGSIIFSLANVQGRTTDAWMTSFITAVREPTQRIWHKRGHPPAFLLPGFHIEHKLGTGKGQSKYELEKFIQLWDPISPTSEFSQEEIEILSRVKEHGGLASAISTTVNHSSPGSKTN